MENLLPIIPSLLALVGAYVGCCGVMLCIVGANRRSGSGKCTCRKGQGGIPPRQA